MAAAALPLRGALRAGFISLGGKLSPAAVRITLRRNYGVVTSQAGEKVTHTGQVYEEKDYRRVRFVGRQKEVNENFAIDLIAEQPVSEVETRVVWCDGGGGALGHPKVYINLDKDTQTGTCGYCGLQFKQKHHH
ncbi:NADH dehydrogenase [ubiquinone] iron-sulfur protein 6, mitochondrial [Protobothrops mucrosquamatus]|uniref:NADH dehydrogenase [ubiquinone] iron-sulfur protein 6, mitochondrial n=1 Tax=Protobothrops mucrosquamatus TaxID=103944 RepID=UPI000775D1B7|nr:NADH dehydrogenase [ubiquinone] iron-sulfur protein 6, mitochondrial [Protobothrops mucrosquamatus]